MIEKTIIFSDGSSRGNPGPGGWGTIVAHGNTVIEFGGADIHTTNNKMELLGAIRGLQSLKKVEGEIVMHTDSSYVINGITKWVKDWQKNNWKTSLKEDVTNRDLWEELIVASTNKKVIWQYVPGHVGVAGNERCDEIATAFADGENPKLFSGKKSDYPFDLSNIKGDGSIKKSKTKNKGIAYSYVSLVNGIISIDKSWKECEKRVKGVKGNVKFKKAISALDEKNIITLFKK